MPARKRLHITPLYEQLLSTILPDPVLQQASNISFHVIPTFPEKSYGYVDLPDAEADRLKKKLNGSVLKGLKMRIEEARPKKLTPENSLEDALKMEASDAKVLRSKRKRVKEEGVISGHELTDRKIKRGWTESTSGNNKKSTSRKDKPDKKSNPKPISLTGEAECLFKTTIPPNAITSGNTQTKDSGAKKRKRGASNRNIIVHEFTNTTKHANFLRDESGAGNTKRASEYVEGTGWVDGIGNIVEEEPAKPRPKGNLAIAENSKPEETRKTRSAKSSKGAVPSVRISSPTNQDARATPPNETSSDGTSSSSENETASDESSPEPIPDSVPSKKTSKGISKRQKAGLAISEVIHGEVEVDQVERLSITRSSPTPPPDEDTPPIPNAAGKEVHPLEALFKRPKIAASCTPKKPALEVTTNFKLSDPDIDENGIQGQLIPQTPFTQQDIRQRRQRSAAPTPDTAAPGKTFSDMWAGTSDNEEDEDGIKEEQTPRSTKAGAQELTEEKPESEFSKWFWEHRGETNRAWKRRRREAAKEKRQKDNKERKN
ncbi:hypothetical protein MMC28_002810 [Mycoblastus sanguinarius]|nr:hypothetical protein [Mycoblastus sanguinarius]